MNNNVTNNIHSSINLENISLMSFLQQEEGEAK